MSDSALVTFDSSSGSDVVHFLFYFENVAEPDQSDEEKALAIIKYFGGRAFQLYCR